MGADFLKSFSKLFGAFSNILYFCNIINLNVLRMM